MCGWIDGWLDECLKQEGSVGRSFTSMNVVQTKQRRTTLEEMRGRSGVLFVDMYVCMYMNGVLNAHKSFNKLNIKENKQTNKQKQQARKQKEKL